MPHITTYLHTIGQELAAGNATEHTHRTALKLLIEALAPDATATNEPKRVKCGAPDYIVTKGLTPLGYIEAKDVGVALDKAEKSEQLGRYRESLGNLVLTDYLEFRWYVQGEHRLTARLASLNGKQIVPATDGGAAVRELLAAFLQERGVMVASPKDLAQRMAAMARIIRDAIQRALDEEDLTDDKPDPLHEQLKAFQQVLLHDLNEARFADMYAQTICYGLFAARCNVKGSEFSRMSAAYDLPKTNPFLRKLFAHIAGPDLDERVAWAVDDLAELLGRADIAAILQDFGGRTRQEDPVVHFYETFLAAYDPKMREARGVYYTPEPVVSYIVRSVDHILRQDFALPAGLAESGKVTFTAQTPDGPRDVTTHKVLLLDPATGTGTFLYSVIKHIRRGFERNQGMWPGYVAEHLLPRLFGFELLMAAYAVAHMKLGLLLAETGYDFRSDERLGVYLTNTLDEVQQLAKAAAPFTLWLNQEADAASKIKQDAPVMVVLGNPPYSGHSANTGEWMRQLLRGMDTHTGRATGNYFMVDGRPLGEKNPKWLNDDYVKFIRFAQWRIEQTGYGILAFVTNHGYLDNPTFRGMRQSLMATFDDIYLLDLHGNSKKKERAPDGGKDENVFDIQQGVAIGIFVKKHRAADTGRTADTDCTAVVPTAGLSASRAQGGAQDAPRDSQQDAGGTASIKHILPPRFGEVRIRQRGRLPHWEIEGGTYSVTFRLGDSLPQSVLDEYEIEREAVSRAAANLKRPLSRAEEKKLDQLFNDKIEDYLDAGYGACYMNDPRIARLVANALKFFHGPRYRLLAWTVMPNHVHVVFHPLPGYELEDILHSWKSFTSKEANKILQRSGRFWQREYHDHLVRDQEDLYRVIRYVANNPKKAGLRDWPWVEVLYSNPEFDISAESESTADTDCTAVVPTAGLSASRAQGGAQDAPQDSQQDAGGTKNYARVRHAHLFGARETYETNVNDERELSGGKYHWLSQHDASNTAWTELAPTAPFYLFTPQDVALRDEYERGWKVTDIMPVNVLGFQTHRDFFAIAFDESEMRARVQALRGTEKTDEELRQDYGLTDNRDWQLRRARQQIRADREWQKPFLRTLYRPFDWRPCYFSDAVMDYPRRELLDHVAGKDNFCLNIVRQTKMETWQHAVVSNAPAPAVYVEVKDGSSLFPLYLYPTAKASLFADEPTDAPGGRRANLAPEFVADLAARLGLAFIPDGRGNHCTAVVPTAGLSASCAQGGAQDAPQDSQQDAGGTNSATFGPEDVFHYLYAVLHAPAYRARYADFLKIDFPRVPLTSDIELFRRLCFAGAELVALHLMERHGPALCGYPQAGDNIVAQVRYDEENGRVWINNAQYFEGVPPAVWAFHIGGYQVCQKWLKDRKERALSYDDLQHYQRIVAALAETVRLMDEIDQTIETHGGWPLPGGRRP